MINSELISAYQVDEVAGRELRFIRCNGIPSTYLVNVDEKAVRLINSGDTIYISVNDENKLRDLWKESRAFSDSEASN